MFGFTGSDAEETLLRKQAHRADAQARWPFLTSFEASTIKNERQLVTELWAPDHPVALGAWSREG